MGDCNDLTGLHNHHYWRSNIVFKNLKLAPKMLFAFGLTAFLTLLVGILGVYSSTNLSNALNYMGKSRVTDLRSLSGLNY